MAADGVPELDLIYLDIASDGDENYIAIAVVEHGLEDPVRLDAQESRHFFDGLQSRR